MMENMKNCSGNNKSPINPKLFKPIKPWIRRTDLNKKAQGMLSDFHVKTHFKAAEEIAENKSNF